MFAAIYSDADPLDNLPRMDGRCLNGRMLLHYLWPDIHVDLRKGLNRKIWATPTAYSPQDASRYLCLFQPWVLRKYAVLIDPTRVSDLRGPKRVAAGGGIEFLLLDGAPPEALSPPIQVEVR